MDTDGYPPERRLAGLARFQPATVDPQEVLSLVHAGMSQEVADAVFQFTRARPGATAPHADTVFRCLEGGPDRRSVGRPLAKALGALAGDRPDAVDTLESLAKGPSYVVRGQAVRGLAVAAETAPEAALPVVDTLFSRLTDTGSIPLAAADALSILSAHDGAIRAQAETDLQDGAPDERVGATYFFGKVSERRGTADGLPVESMVALLEAPDVDTEETLSALEPLATAAPDRFDQFVPWLLSYVEDSEAVVHPQTEAVALLRTLADDPDVYVAMIERLSGGPRDLLGKPVADLAADHPTVVAEHRETFLELLEHGHRYAQRNAAYAIGNAARERPERFAFAVDPLLVRLEYTWERRNWGALSSTCGALCALTPAYPQVPTRVVGILDVSYTPSRGLFDRLRGRRVTIDRDPAVYAAETIARSHPTVLYESGAVPPLIDVLEAGGDTTEHAAKALGWLGRAHPAAMSDIAPVLTGAVLELGAGNVPEGVYRGLTEAARIDPVEVNRAREPLMTEFSTHRTRTVWDVVGLLASEYQAVFDRVIDLHADGQIRLKQTLVTLATATETSPETARPHVDRFVTWAVASEERSNATAALAGIADGEATALTDHVDTIGDLLYDPDRETREAACRVAGGLLAAVPGDAKSLVPRLERLCQRDSAVQQTAQRALSEVSGDGPR